MGIQLFFSYGSSRSSRLHDAKLITPGGVCWSVGHYLGAAQKLLPIFGLQRVVPLGKRVVRLTAETLDFVVRDLDAGGVVLNPNRKIFEARKRETAALGAGEKLVLGHPLAATIGDSARCMQNLEKVLFTGPKTSDTVTFICD